MKETKRVAGLSVGIILVIQALENGFSVEEEKVRRKSQGTGVYVAHVQSTKNTISRVFTSAIEEHQSSFYSVNLRLAYAEVLCVQAVFPICALARANNLSDKSGEQMFDTGGLLLLIGAAIPLIGEVLKFIAWILVAVGFFSIKKSIQRPRTAPEVSAVEKTNFCQYCGSQINSDSAR